MDKIPILSIILMKEPDLNNVISRELRKNFYLFLFIQYGTKWTFTLHTVPKLTIKITKRWAKTKESIKKPQMPEKKSEVKPNPRP